jgi:hypothetical protein
MLVAMMAVNANAQTLFTNFTTAVSAGGTYYWDLANWGTTSTGPFNGNWQTPYGFAEFRAATASYTVVVSNSEPNIGMIQQGSGTVTINASATGGSLNIVTNGGTLTDAGGYVQGFFNTLTINAPVVGAGGISQGGTLSLLGNNTYSGGTVLNGSLLNFNNNNSFGAGPIYSTVSGGTTTSPKVGPILSQGGSLITLPNNWIMETVNSGLNFGSAANTPVKCTGTWTLTQTAYIKNNGNTTAPLTLSGVMSGPGGFVAMGNNGGTIFLQGANTYAGPTTIGNVSQSGAITLSVSSINYVNSGLPSNL